MTDVQKSLRPKADSSTWRMNRSNIQSIELANAVRSLRKVVGLMEQQTISVAFNSEGSSYNNMRDFTIRIDPRYATKSTPITPEDFDVLVGLATHEAMHSVADSEQLTIDYASMIRGEINVASIAVVAEEVYCDHLARRQQPVAFKYLRKARQAYCTSADNVDWSNPLEAWANVSIYGVLPPPEIPTRTLRALRILSKLSMELSKRDYRWSTRKRMYTDTVEKLEGIIRELEAERKLRKNKLGEGWDKALSGVSMPQPTQSNQQSSEKQQQPGGSGGVSKEKGDEQPGNDKDNDQGDANGGQDTSDQTKNSSNDADPNASSSDDGNDDVSGQNQPSREQSDSGDAQDSGEDSAATDSGKSSGSGVSTEPDSGAADQALGESKTPGPAGDIGNQPINQAPSSSGQPTHTNDHIVDKEDALRLNTLDTLPKDLADAIDEALEQDIQDLLDDLMKLDGYHDTSGLDAVSAVTYRRPKPDPEPNFNHNLYNQLIWVKLLRNSMDKVTHRGLDYGKLDSRNLHRAVMDGNAFKRNKRLEHQKTKLVLLLDRSTSMGSHDNPVYQAAAAIHKALPGDVVVYSYSAQSGIASGSVAVEISNHTANRQFDRIRPGGNTPSGVALLSTATLNRDATIIHFTDGESNIGITPVEAWNIIDREFPKVKLIDIRVRPHYRTPSHRVHAEISDGPKVKVIRLSSIEDFPGALREAVRPWVTTL